MGVMSIVVTRELTGYEAGDIAITAVEGGIGYWANVESYDYQRWSPDGRAPINVSDDFVFYTLREDALDDESYEASSRDVTPAVIARGIQRHLSGVPGFISRGFHDMSEFAAMDADEADAVIQLGLFGELRYG